MFHLHFGESPADKKKRQQAKQELYTQLGETIKKLVAQNPEAQNPKVETPLGRIQRKYNAIKSTHLQIDPLKEIQKLINNFVSNDKKNDTSDTEISVIHPSISNLNDSHHQLNEGHYQTPQSPTPPQPLQLDDPKKHHAPPEATHHPHENTHAIPILGPHPIVDDESAKITALKEELKQYCPCLLENLFQEFMPKEFSTCNLDELKPDNAKLPGIEQETYLDNYLSFFAKIIEYEKERRQVLTAIDAINLLSEKESVEQDIAGFHAVEKRIFNVLKLIYNKMLIKREMIQLLLNEEKLPETFFPPSEKLKGAQIALNENMLKIAPDGHYVNANLPPWNALADEKNEGGKLQSVSDEILQLSFPLYVQMRRLILKAISVLQPSEPPTQAYTKAKEEIFTQITELTALGTGIAEKINQRNAFIDSRQALKSHLYLDKQNFKHVERWSQENYPCFHGYGGIVVQVKDDKDEEHPLRIPSHIYQMMEVIEKDYPDVETFEAALNEARTKRNSYFVNPLSFWTRSTLTQMIYEEPNINKFEPFKVPGP